MVRPSLEWNPQGQYLGKTDIDAMSTWQINALRLDLNQNYWFSSAATTQIGSYKQIINAIIYYATHHGLVVILDLHWTENGHQSPMANKASLRFWKEVAQEYKGFGTVLFELYNEPVNISKHTWLHGDATYAGYQALYDAVRSTGAKNICIFNGLDYGYDLSFVNQNFEVKGTNLIYGSHPYNEKGDANYMGSGGSFAQNFAGVINRYPLIFTEFGVNESSYFPTGYQAVYERIIQYAVSNHISYTGFAWWVEQNNPNTFPALIKDFKGTPLNGGVNIFNDLKTHPPIKLTDM